MVAVEYYETKDSMIWALTFASLLHKTWSMWVHQDLHVSFVIALVGDTLWNYPPQYQRHQQQHDNEPKDLPNDLPERMVELLELHYYSKVMKMETALASVPQWKTLRDGSIAPAVYLDDEAIISVAAAVVVVNVEEEIFLHAWVKLLQMSLLQCAMVMIPWRTAVFEVVIAASCKMTKTVITPYWRQLVFYLVVLLVVLAVQFLDLMNFDGGKKY